MTWKFVGLFLLFPGTLIMNYVSQLLGHSWKDPLLPPLTYAIGLALIAFA